MSRPSKSLKIAFLLFAMFLLALALAGILFFEDRITIIASWGLLAIALILNKEAFKMLCK